METTGTKTINALKNSLPQRGKIEWIGLRPSKKAGIIEVDTAILTTEKGLEGDHYRGSSGKRQVTLIQAEHLHAVSHFMGLPELNPVLVRRNILVSGINLFAFNKRQFFLGEEVVLEMTGFCHPCSRMEEALGSGGYNAMRGHGGITARVIKGGRITLGQAVTLSQP